MPLGEGLRPLIQLHQHATTENVRNNVVEQALMLALQRNGWRSTMGNKLHEYQYARSFILSHIRQVRMMMRDQRYMSEAFVLIKRAQAEAARLRSRAYGAA